MSLTVSTSSVVIGIITISVAVGSFLYKQATEQAKIKYVVGRMADEMNVEKPENW